MIPDEVTEDFDGETADAEVAPITSNGPITTRAYFYEGRN